jgi:hypothetical protein
MASAKKTSRKTSAAVGVVGAGVATLAEIVAATLDETKGFIYTSPAVHTPLVEAGLVEVNPQMPNPDQAEELATRATQKGIDQVNTATAPETAAVSNASANGFKLEANVPVPAIAGRGRTGTTYPFDIMEVGHSFFVQNDAEKPNAAKSLASTVSSANARYAVGTGEFKAVKVPVYQTDESGKRVKDAEGKLIKTGEVEEQREVMKQTRTFIVRSVTENGVAGARIWRTA